MRSPFPGMDPYLEDPTIWMDFHQSFICYCRDALASALPDRYEARIEERVSLVQLPDDEIRWVRNDLAVSDVGSSGSAAVPPSGGRGLLTMDPVTVPLIIYDELHESRVHILDRSDRRLVTVLELLSPTNKVRDGLEQYLSKRNTLLRTPVNLVEIDLLIAGERLPHKEPLPPGDYFVYVARGNRRPDCEIFGWSVRQAIPAIPIPLRAPDADVILDLQKLLETTYERGRYRSLKYSRKLELPLAQDDLAWAARTAAMVAQ